MSGSTIRFLLTAALITAAAVFLYAHTSGEVFPARQPLKSFPSTLGDREGTDITIDPDVLTVLGPGDFLLRDYRSNDDKQSAIDLFIAYFASQRAGDTIHSPKNCLPGAGWTPTESARIALSLAGHAPFPANRYVIAKGDTREIVLYWYWAHDRGVASEYWAKYYLVADSIRMNRSDGALVRLSSLMSPGESPDAAERRLIPLAGQIVPLLDNYIPR